MFSSPFDETAVDFLERMNVPCYKIASYEATDFVLLRKVAQTKKPVIMSVGYASVAEIECALETLRKYGTEEVALLHCVTGYANRPDRSDSNLRVIADLERRFGVVAGFSDNNAGIEIPFMAVASGARIIEKHLILDRKQGGPDAKFSLEPLELKKLVKMIRTMETSRKKVGVPNAVFGEVHYGPVNLLEEYNIRFRRSLFSGKAIKKGEVFTKENVRDVRPGFGLETKYYDTVLEKRAACDIPFATPLSWEMVEK